MYRLYNYNLGHYQYYFGGEEVVELRDKNEVESYIKNYPNDYRVDLFVGGELVKKEAYIR